MNDGGADRSDWFPSGIVLLPPAPACGPPRPRRPVEAEQVTPHSRTCWTVVDADGAHVGRWSTHRETMAELGRLALRGAPLPLRVHGPDGHPTGDRLG